MPTTAGAAGLMRAGLRGALCAVLAWGAVLGAQATPSIDDFFGLPMLGDARLSPSGRYLAVVVGGSTAARARLGIIDLEDRAKPPKVIARFDEADVAGMRWLDHRRLVFYTVDVKAPTWPPRAHGIWAIDLDGSNPRELISRNGREDANPVDGRVEFGLHGSTHDGTGDVFTYYLLWDKFGDYRGRRPLRLDTRTGTGKSIGLSPDLTTVDWVMDAKGDARAAVSFAKGVNRLYWRAQGQTAWTLLSEEPGGVFDRVTPRWVDGENLYVTAPHGPKGLRALFRFDMATRKPETKPLFDIDGFDYNGGLEIDSDTGRVVGIHYAADARGSHWFDAGLQAAQREVDAQLKSTVNQLTCSQCTGAERLLVRASSDRQPDLYFLYSTKTRKLELLGHARPGIDARKMAKQDYAVIKARDGRDIPTYVTTPPGKSAAPRPAVVLVHGGPHVRGNVWGWNAEAQFLASRGYVVIEPEFRGSAGFGSAHFAAGFKQMGLAMQDDVTDATLWAIREAGVDAQRICIAGAGYGGYATLMGMVREPALYRCGVSWAGVTDPALMFKLLKSDMTEEVNADRLAQMLGDPVADKARFALTSPIEQAARITQPVLIAHGSEDRRVPLEYGKRFRDAAMQTNKEVDWIVYEGEGHGFGDPKNLRDFWGRVEKFLDRNIGAAKP